MHRAYARSAQVVLAPLEDYERKTAKGKVVKLHDDQAKGTKMAPPPLQTHNDLGQSVWGATFGPGAASD
jgi:hypothetical protein